MSNYICPLCKSDELVLRYKTWIKLSNIIDVFITRIVIPEDTDIVLCKHCNEIFTFKEIRYSNNGDNNG